MEIIATGRSQSSYIQDELLIHRIIDGEKELFEILMRRYNQTLYRAVRSYLDNENDIKDIMQNAYIKAFTKLIQFKGKASFSTWLIRIGINESLLYLRKVRKKRIFLNSSNYVSENVSQLQPVFDMNPEKRAIQKETTFLIERAVDQLPQKYKIIYMLKEVEGMENEEIAASLGLTYSNVKVRLHRAKGLLKEKLFDFSATSEIFQFGNSKCDLVVDEVMKKLGL